MAVDALPFPLTAEVLDRGEQRFNIYCTPCHGLAGQRRRHDRAARLPPAAVVPHRPAAHGAARPLLRRHDERLRRDAGLSRADRAAGSLGDRRLRARAATEPARARRGAARRKSGRSFRNRRPRPRPASTSANEQTQHSRPSIRPASTACSSGADGRPSAGLVVGAIGVFLQPDQFLPSWLIGFLFCTGLSLRLPRAADAAAHDRRAVGPGHAADLRGGQPAAAALRGAVRPGRGLRAEAVSLGAARSGQRPTRSSSSRRRT